MAAESSGCGARISPVLVEYVIPFDPLNAFLAKITKFAESTCISSAFALIPLPPTMSSDLVDDISPQPVKPAPAVIDTDV